MTDPENEQKFASIIVNKRGGGDARLNIGCTPNLYKPVLLAAGFSLRRSEFNSGAVLEEFVVDN